MINSCDDAALARSSLHIELMYILTHFSALHTQDIVLSVMYVAVLNSEWIHVL